MYICICNFCIIFMFIHFFSNYFILLFAYLYKISVRSICLFIVVICLPIQCYCACCYPLLFCRRCTHTNSQTACETAAKRIYFFCVHNSRLCIFCVFNVISRNIFANNGLYTHNFPLFTRVINAATESCAFHNLN